MPTQKQLEANRLNALKSTGPRSAAGKDASRLNALKSGLYAKSLVIRGESREQFDTLVAEYDAQYLPETPQARTLVDAVIRATWLMRRLDRIESDLWDDSFQSLSGKVYRIADAFRHSSKSWAAIRRYYDSLDRSLHRNLKALKDQQMNTVPVETKPVTPEIGFVLSDPPPPPPDPSAPPRLRVKSEAPEASAPLEEAS